MVESDCETNRTRKRTKTMDEERFETVAAQVLASHIVIAAIVDLFPDPGLLRETIAKHAKGLL
jgi:hypothetical protein